MIKPDWDIFKAKFSENPQENFERLCYLLFCEEFGLKNGIPRYFNQPSIETEPIRNGSIGFQAKFFETTLSKNTQILSNTISNAQKNYTSLTTLIIYTNQEWALNNKNNTKSKVQKKIEKQARDLNIDLKWKTKSYFESKITYYDHVIFEYFFTYNNGIIKLIQNEIINNLAFLKTIETDITFNNRTITVCRQDTLEILNDISNKTFVIYGDGGVGKTSIVKQLYEQKQDDDFFYILNATRLKINKALD